MCTGILQSHYLCGHVKKFFIATRCENALRSGNNCRRSQCSLLGAEVASLPFCIMCYRKAEKEICDQADEAICQVTQCADGIQQWLKLPYLAPQERYVFGDLALEAADLVDEIRRNRLLNLSKFRESQGVWGDG